jgi:hypothetical protein
LRARLRVESAGARADIRNGGGGRLAQDAGLLAVEFFFGQRAFIAKLLELAKLMDDAVLGVRGRVVGRIGAVVLIDAGGGPNQADDPRNKGPAQEKVYGKDAAGARMPPHRADDGGKKIEDKADAAKGEGEWAVKKVEGIEQIHTAINLPIFFL